MSGLDLTALRLGLGAFSLDVGGEQPLRFAPRGLTAIFGRSGSGKSTLLRVIAGLERRASGQIRFAGQDWQGPGLFVPPHRRRIGYVFQDARLFPHLSVRGNLEYGLKRAAERHGPGLNDVADMLGIAPLLDRKPNTLSGGEGQRVAIGRALLSRPQLLLMDEPLASLDAPRKAEILPYLERLRDEAGLPILYVSHDVSEIARLSRHIVMVQDGRVVLSGEAQSVFADPSAARFFGIREAGALIGGRIAAHHADGVTELETRGGLLFLPRLGHGVGTKLRLRILAQDVMIARVRPEQISALNILNVMIAGVQEGDGPGVVLSLKAGDDSLLARITRRSFQALGLGVGMHCHAVIKSVSVAQADVGTRGEPTGEPDQLRL